VQKLIAWHSAGKEVGVKMLQGHFAKRPNAIEYPSDVIEFAKNRASSFHISEEHWKNPWALSSSLKRKELDELRDGWDLVLDLDFPVWEPTKLITHFVIRALRDHGINSISCKFSGNKGFHVGVPFKAFPSSVLNQKTTDLFPEGPKKIMNYIVNYIDNREKGYPLSKQILKSKEFQLFMKENPTEGKKLILDVCANCGRILNYKPQKKIIYKCQGCGKEIQGGEEPYKICPNCSRVMKRIEFEVNNKCDSCGSEEREQKINLAIDEILIASRHLYRAPYSLHEKSGLVSLPIDPDSVLEFDKKRCSPEAVLDILDGLKSKDEEEFFNSLRTRGLLFLDSYFAQPGEASSLIREAFDFDKQNSTTEFSTPAQKAARATREGKGYKIYEDTGERFDEQTFPPCIKMALKGVSDGRKRLLFILFNFLRASGWNIDDIQRKIEEWNEKNEEPLRPGLIKGHFEYHRKRKLILPPNCNSSGYYKDMGICHPDNICSRIKNPATYPKVYSKVYLSKKSKGKGKRKARKKAVEGSKGNKSNKGYKGKIKQEDSSKEKKQDKEQGKDTNSS
jgi:DNA-directed RNA polymerase subunit RPC12/RpoP